MAPINIKELESATSISGPYELFAKSFILEFLEPPQSLDATVLMRCTYISPTKNPLGKLGRKHPQSPPLHLHFDQAESFVVVQGQLCTLQSYGVEEKTWGVEDGVQCIEPWVPHDFHPSPDAEEDTIVYVWAHPSAVIEPMDRLFFQTLLRYVSECYEKDVFPGLMQIMVTQHASATALIMFPTAWWLGPLRWWVPWQFQRGVAAVGRALGYRALMREYTTQEEWEEYMHAKRA